MKYLFDMGEVWHVYSDVGRQWIYQRLEQTGEEVLEKSGENLPGPLGRLDILKELENECERLRMQIIEQEEVRENLENQYEKEKEKLKQKNIQAKEENREVQQKIEVLKKQMVQLREDYIKEQSKALAIQKSSFEKSYTELQTMAEEFQKEGKLWRQRYLDLSYQISQNNGK